MEDPGAPSGVVSPGNDLSRVKQELDFRRIADSVPGCILVADGKGKIVYANKGIVGALGRTVEELLGDGWLESLEPAFLEQAREVWAHCIQTNQPLDVTWKFRRNDGTYRWLHVKAQPAFHEECNSTSWYLLGVDVDEQFQIQEALRASEREAREILDRVPAMISTRTEEGVAYTNKQLSDYVGAVITDLRDGAYLDYTHPDDREAIVREHIKSPDKAPNDIVYRLRGKDGIYRWFHTRAEPYFNEDGTVYRWYAVNNDIDDFYRSRELLREREFQLNLLTETLPALLWKAAPDGKIIYINKKAMDFAGRTLDELQQKGWFDLVHPEDRDEVLTRWNQLLAGGDGYDIVHRLIAADGQYRWFHTSIAVIKDESGKTIAFHGVMLDTTVQRNAEIALQQSEEQMRRVMDTVPSIIWSLDPTGKATFINKKARECIGMSLEEYQDSGWVEIIHPDDRAFIVEEHGKALANGTSYGAKHRTRCADGIFRWHLSRAEPLRDAEGRIIQWFGVVVDIDDQMRAVERLRELRANLSQTSRTALVAELSASIAHELNQPLTSLLSNAQACFRWLQASPPNIGEAVSSTERIIRDCRAADTVIRNVRSLFKRQPSVKAPFNFIELIREAVGLIKEDANRKSTLIKWDYEEPIIMVLVDRFQTQQIIINLVSNAIEAMQDLDRTPRLHIRIRRVSNGQVLTEFIDNGPGLPDGDAERIFDAFVTTKENGMGIGLAISRSIVEAHDGQLWAANNPDVGAKFSLLLKSAEPDAGHSSDENPT
ncbi:PAS domain-containing protein [Edaphobacter aggregans]|uniref:PAS domain-containing protein n=1 Tax=Edaphobacter aggregans TaxID=570835 RepID=UPI0005553959|nr:PAS domain-containing protein [Edaphobacter aggregans]